MQSSSFLLPLNFILLSLVYSSTILLSYLEFLGYFYTSILFRLVSHTFYGKSTFLFTHIYLLLIHSYHFIVEGNSYIYHSILFLFQLNYCFTFLIILRSFLWFPYYLRSLSALFFISLAVITLHINFFLLSSTLFILFIPAQSSHLMILY